MNNPKPPQGPRSYRQSARAEAAHATRREILNAFSACMQTGWFDESTLDEVAERAGVNVRTVIRAFGGKDGLLQHFVDHFSAPIREQRRTPAQDPRAAVEALFEIYEVWGDSVIRNLAQEPRHPALSILLDHGRTNHRRITEETYARWLDPLSGDDRQLTLDALVAATDIYVWKLARRDMRRSREECLELLCRLVDAVLAQAEKLATPPERRP